MFAFGHRESTWVRYPGVRYPGDIPGKEPRRNRRTDAWVVTSEEIRAEEPTTEE
jgi:hypothetical protein